MARKNIFINFFFHLIRFGLSFYSFRLIVFVAMRRDWEDVSKDLSRENKRRTTSKVFWHPRATFSWLRHCHHFIFRRARLHCSRWERVPRAPYYSIERHIRDGILRSRCPTDIACTFVLYERAFVSLSTWAHFKRRATPDITVHHGVSTQCHEELRMLISRKRDYISQNFFPEISISPEHQSIYFYLNPSLTYFFFRSFFDRWVAHTQNNV